LGNAGPSQVARVRPLLGIHKLHMLGAHLQSFGSSQLFSPGTLCVRVGHVCVRERKGEVPERQDKGNNNGALIQGQLCTGMCLAAHLPVYQQVFVRISKLMNNTDLHITHAKKLFTIHGRKNPTCPKNPLPPGLCAAPGFVRRTRFFWL